MLFKSATRPFSMSQRKYLGYGLSIFSSILFLLGHFLNGPIAGLAIFFAIPLLLVSLSILFGQASKGQGIFSSFTLYAIAFIIIGFSIWSGIKGINHYSWAGAAFGSAIIVVAKSRAKQNKT